MFGSHLSIAGGLYHAIEEAQELDLQTVQIFTRNQQQWKSSELQPQAIADFRKAADAAGFSQIVAHDSYLVNLAAPDPHLRKKSLESFTNEIQRCDILGIRYLVTHGGSHGGAGEEEGLNRLTDSLRAAFAATPDAAVTVCLETTAGQGHALCWRFEHLARIIQEISAPARIGVCMDTCHILAAGYDITSEAGMANVWQEFDRVVGLDQVKVLHLNDSLKPLGSRVDRHAHIGRGYVGLGAFRFLARHPRLKHVPKILETAKENAPDSRPWDVINLQVLRALAAGKAVKLKRFSVPDKKTEGMPAVPGRSGKQ